MIQPRIGCYGKLPAFGDFVRLHDELAPVDLLHRWYTAGEADPHQQPALHAGFAASPPVFAITMARNHWWGMALFASRDQVGRAYPFAVMAGLPTAEVGEEIALLPLLFLDLFREAYVASTRGWAGDAGSLRNQVAGLVRPVDPLAVERQFDDGLSSMPANDLWRAFLGHSGDPRRSRVIADVAAAAVGQVRGEGLRIAPAAHPIQLGFWLLLLWRLRTHPGVPALIAMHPAGTGSLTVCFDRPTAQTCHAALWPQAAAPASRAALADLLAGCQGTPPFDPAALNQILAEPDHSLRDLAHHLLNVLRPGTGRYRRSNVR